MTGKIPFDFSSRLSLGASISRRELTLFRSVILSFFLTYPFAYARAAKAAVLELDNYQWSEPLTEQTIKWVRESPEPKLTVEFNGQYVRHPVRIAFALLELENIAFGSPNPSISKEAAKEKLEKWISIVLNDHGAAIEGRLIYNVDFLAGKYFVNMKSGWGSAMAQGCYLSALARAYILFPSLRSKIKVFAHSLLLPFSRDARHHGVLSHVQIPRGGGGSPT